MSALEKLRRKYLVRLPRERQDAIAEAYRPIVGGFLLAAALFYLLIAASHVAMQEGWHRAILVSTSLVAVIAYFAMRRRVLSHQRLSLAKLEIIGLGANFLIYLNVLTHALLQFNEGMLIYFPLMAMVYSMSGVTLRSTLLSVSVALVSLYVFIQDMPAEIVSQYVFISLASTFASLGITSLLKKAILRQIEARLVADEMAQKAQVLAEHAQTVADHDSLTNLPNRRSILQKLDRLTQEGQPFWFGVLDLDGFKSINDSYGHITGDALLIKIAERLNGFVDQTVSVGRLAGDEFALFIQTSGDETTVRELGDRILARISMPCELNMLRLAVGGSAGFAHFPSMAATGSQLYEHADYALYSAKENARGRTLVFNAREQAEMTETAKIEKALRQADFASEMYLEFQPQRHVIEDRICGFEALARWQSPVLGPVPPDKFIRVAERTGLIQIITATLFRKSLVALAQWPAETSVSFNLSARDLADRNFIFSLVAEVYKAGLLPSRIEFEITETAVMADFEAARLLLADLAAAGFKIALDDFGSGYSSFQYIDMLPLNKIKIDKSFVRRLTDNATSREIVSSVISLCHTLGLKCVLEGVETQTELDALTTLKAEIIQGYFFGKPMPVEDATAQVSRPGKHLATAV